MPSCSSPVPGRLLMFPMATRHWVDASPNVGSISLGVLNDTNDVGPDMAFGRELLRLGSSGPIGLIGTALSSTSLAVDWKPGGKLWINMMKAISQGIDNAKSELGLDPVIRGLIWVQGENDGISSKAADAYRSNLEYWIDNNDDYIVTNLGQRIVFNVP